MKRLLVLYCLLFAVLMLLLAGSLEGAQGGVVHSSGIPPVPGKTSSFFP